MFNIGDRIVYPMHGAGYIEAIEQKEIGGMMREYYAVSIPGANIKLSIPVENSGSIQLRAVIDAAGAERVIEYFRALEIDMTVPWGRRYKENLERLKTGRLEEVAEVLKALMLRDKTVGLSTGDRQVIVMARQIFYSELSMALERDKDLLQNELQNIVNEQI